MRDEAAGLSERVTVAPVHEGQRKEHGWVVISTSLTLPSAQPIAGEVI